MTKAKMTREANKPIRAAKREEELQILKDVKTSNLHAKSIKD